MFVVRDAPTSCGLTERFLTMTELLYVNVRSRTLSAFLGGHYNRQLFQKVIVKPLGTVKVQLKFIFRNVSSTCRRLEDTFCTSVDRVGCLLEW